MEGHVRLDHMKNMNVDLPRALLDHLEDGMWPGPDISPALVFLSGPSFGKYFTWFPRPPNAYASNPSCVPAPCYLSIIITITITIDHLGDLLWKDLDLSPGTRASERHLFLEKSYEVSPSTKCIKPLLRH
jgi:hypothetical protein